MIAINLLWVVPYRAPLIFLTLIGPLDPSCKTMKRYDVLRKCYAKRKIKGEECDLCSQTVRPMPASEKEES